MEQEIDLVKLRSKLPHGYSKLLQTRLLQNYSKKYALHTIRRALTKNYPNDLIINEAIELAAELENQRNKNVQKLKNLD